jgi:hypothetical protein
MNFLQIVIFEQTVRDLPLNYIFIADFPTGFVLPRGIDKKLVWFSYFGGKMT